MRTLPLVSVLVLVCSIARAGDDFYLVDNAEDGFYRSNTDDVSGDVFVSDLGSGFWADLAPSDVIDHLFLARADKSGPILYRIRQSDGALVTALIPDEPIRSIGYDLSSDALYGVNTSVGDNRLFRINVESGETELIGDTGISDVVTALVFDPDTALLFAANSVGLLFAIDPSNAATIQVGSTGLSSPFGLAWNPADSQLYVTDATTDGLYTVDRTNAEVSFVGGPYRLATFATGLSFQSRCTLHLDVEGPLAMENGLVLKFRLLARHNIPTVVTAPIGIRVVGAGVHPVVARSYGPVRFEPGSSFELVDTLSLPSWLTKGRYQVIATVDRMHRIDSVVRSVAIP